MNQETPWAYGTLPSIDYQANAGQTMTPAEANTAIQPFAFTPAPDPESPLPIELTLRPEMAEKGIVIGRIGRQEFLPGVTAQMLDWFWANMEKCYYLWAPGEHKSFRWLRSPCEVGFLKSAHEIVEPAGPILMRIQISRLDPQEWYPFTQCLDHVICEGIYNDKGEVNDATVHLWQDVPGGCIHISTTVVNTAISELPACIQKLEADMGAFMAAHAPEGAPEGEAGASAEHAEFESAMWPVFLPTMYGLWKDHPDPSQNISCCLKVEKTPDGSYRYINCK